MLLASSEEDERNRPTTTSGDDGFDSASGASASSPDLPKRQLKLDGYGFGRQGAKPPAGSSTAASTSTVMASSWRNAGQGRTLGGGGGAGGPAGLSAYAYSLPTGLGVAQRFLQHNAKLRNPAMPLANPRSRAEERAFELEMGRITQSDEENEREAMSDETNGIGPDDYETEEERQALIQAIQASRKEVRREPDASSEDWNWQDGSDIEIVEPKAKRAKYE